MNPSTGPIETNRGHRRVWIRRRRWSRVECKIWHAGFGFNGPKGIALADNILYIVDTENHALRGIDLRSGIITSVAGTGQRGDGPGRRSPDVQNGPSARSFIQGRKIYIGDSENHRIRLLA